MKYTVTVEKSGVYSEVIAYAADEKAVNRYFESKGKTVVGIREMTSPYIKPGQPVIEIPEPSAEQIEKEIVAWFEENESEYNEAIEQLDSYNGYLGDDRYYEMYMIDEFYHDTNPLELIERVYYGYDEDTSTEDNHTEFNPNREYFRYNGYGNLVSADYKDYSDHLDHWMIESMAENRTEIDVISEHFELSALFDEYEAAKEREEA